MKRFHFELERVRDLRRQQLTAEESKLEALLNERRLLQAGGAKIDAEKIEAERTVFAQPANPAQQLAALSVYKAHLASEKQKLIARQEDSEKRIMGQQKAILEARRRVQLLDKLRERKQAEWQSAFDREQENLAGELFLAKWKGRSP